MSSETRRRDSAGATYTAGSSFESAENVPGAVTTRDRAHRATMSANQTDDDTAESVSGEQSKFGRQQALESFIKGRSDLLRDDANLDPEKPVEALDDLRRLTAEAEFTIDVIEMCLVSDDGGETDG